MLMEKFTIHYSPFIIHHSLKKNAHTWFYTQAPTKKSLRELPALPGSAVNNDTIYSPQRKRERSAYAEMYHLHPVSRLTPHLSRSNPHDNTTIKA
jgi:hypothetical protein